MAIPSSFRIRVTKNILKIPSHNLFGTRISKHPSRWSFWNMMKTVAIFLRFSVIIIEILRDMKYIYRLKMVFSV